MKKTALINSMLSEIISKLGHTDMITIADCGLPIPDGSQRIDLALTRGVPSFEQVLDAVLSELEVEEITLAAEIKQQNQEVLDKVLKKFPGKKVNYIDHESFKKLTGSSKAVVRTGEASPYANIILHCGVYFDR